MSQMRSRGELVLGNVPVGGRGCGKERGCSAISVAVAVAEGIGLGTGALTHPPPPSSFCPNPPPASYVDPGARIGPGPVCKPGVGVGAASHVCLSLLRS